MKDKVLLIIPAFNEEKNIEYIINYLMDISGAGLCGDQRRLYRQNAGDL